MLMKNQPYLGDLIRTEIIQPTGLSVAAAAAALQVPRPSSLLNGSADLSGEMALRIAKTFGAKMDTLLRMPSVHDIAQTRNREKTIRVASDFTGWPAFMPRKAKAEMPHAQRA